MRALLLSALIFASDALAQPDAELLNRLREGGYVLYLRHTSTDFSQNDSRMTSYEDCATQRNLTDRGREEARMLGQHVKRLKIPIGEVLASPFCERWRLRASLSAKPPRPTRCAADLPRTSAAATTL